MAYLVRSAHVIVSARCQAHGQVVVPAAPTASPCDPDASFALAIILAAASRSPGASNLTITCMCVRVGEGQALS
jgi:hypothetical protein